MPNLTLVPLNLVAKVRMTIMNVKTSALNAPIWPTTLPLLFRNSRTFPLNLIENNYANLLQVVGTKYLPWSLWQFESAKE